MSKTPNLGRVSDNPNLDKVSNNPNIGNVSKTPKKQQTLIEDRYPQNDLFICDVADAVLKDIMPEMEHPFYSLSKKPETNVRRYEHNGNWLEITPSVKGLATIYDKDILIYAISQLMEKINRGEAVEKRVRINTHELLQFTNRGVAGKDYKAICDAVTRLGGVQISTNIKTGDEEQFDVFGLIDSSSIRRKHGLDGRLLWCDITLSDWVFNAIKNNEVLTLHRDYFRLRKPMERRIYEIARKQCGRKAWSPIFVTTLHKKSGSQATLKEFRRKVKKIVSDNLLPDYQLEFIEETDKIIFHNRGLLPALPSIEWKGQISADAFEKVGAMQLNIDKYALEQEFREWVKKKGIIPDNADAMFLKFAQGRKRRV